MPKNDANLHDPLEPVRERYREAFPDFAEGRLRTEIVYEIAWLLVQAGVQPTMAAVTAVHGSGSPNLIHPALKTFFASELKARLSFPKESEPDVPAPLRALWTKALSLATQSVEEELEDARAKLADEQTKLKADQDALARAEIALEERTSRLDADHRALRHRTADAIRAQRDAGRRVIHAETQVSALDARLEASLAKQAALEAAHQTATEAQANAEQQAEAMQNALLQAERDLYIHNTETERLREQHAAEQERLQADLAKARDQAAEFAARIAQLESASRADAEQLAAALADARAREDRLTKSLDTTQGQLDVALADAKASAADCGRLLAESVQWRERCNGLESTVAALQHTLAERQARLDAALTKKPARPD